MSTTYTFWSKKARVEGRAGAGVGGLSIYPDGSYSGDQFTIYQRSEMSASDMLTVADRVLADVQRWRDDIAAVAERARTDADELAEARARIAELESAAVDGAR
ncbi:hypothetical protein [Kitasatospora purpeofusca]|uniref:hypothetical protein n=1 Tax=Kitasatospora purpeofusca TaxID=67352 RepID=UPI003647CF18